MKERKTDVSSFEPYLEAAKSGALVPSAGGGFGVERMVRYLTGREHVKDVVLFPRVPGEEIVF
jgi:asparaginyl-tRNA synthetase